MTGQNIAGGGGGLWKRSGGSIIAKFEGDSDHQQSVMEIGWNKDRKIGRDVFDQQE